MVSGSIKEEEEAIMQTQSRMGPAGSHLQCFPAKNDTTYFAQLYILFYNWLFCIGNPSVQCHYQLLV